MKSNRFWLIVLGGTIILSAVFIILLRQPSANYANIYHNGELTDTVDIAAVTAPFTITVAGDTGNNIIAVEQGRIRMLSADCPDGTCVRQGWISEGVFPVVCLPNRVVITLKSGGKGSDIDAVVG